MLTLLPELEELFGAELEAEAELCAWEADDTGRAKKTDDVVAGRATDTDDVVVGGAATDELVTGIATDELVTGIATDEVVTGRATDEVDGAAVDEANGQKTTTSVAVMVVTIRG